MNGTVRKISFSPILALLELLLGAMLLIDAIGLSVAVIIAFGVSLVLAGLWRLLRYLRAGKEEAALSWDLASCAGLVFLGACAIVNQKWLMDAAGSLAVMYGVIVSVAAFMKLQIAVDALRSGRPFWYLMAAGFILTAAITALLFLRVFPESSVWIFSGIVLVALGVLDCVYFVLGRTKK